MENEGAILAQLKLLNENMEKLTAAFNKHCNQVVYGRPTAPPQPFVEKKFSEVRDQMAEAVSKIYSDKYSVQDSTFFESLGFPMMGDVIKDKERMMKLAGIKPIPVCGGGGGGEIWIEKRRDVEPKTYVSTISVDRLPYGMFGYETAKQIFETKGIDELKRQAPAGMDVDSYIKKYGVHWIAPSMPHVDPGEFDDEEKTDPMIKVAGPELVAKRKKDGVCPECGDISRETAVGICRDHGKFMG
jgi:hypothetical protein